MSGLSIDHGGAIAVDTAQLRAVGGRISAVAASYRESREAAARVRHCVGLAPGAFDHVDLVALQRSEERIGALHDEVTDAAAGVFLMADVFEVVELRARAEALAQTDAAAADAIRDRIDRLVSADLRLGILADELEADFAHRRFDGLGSQFDLGGALPPLYFAGAVLGMTTGMGKVDPGETLRGRGDPVLVRPVAASAPAAPKNLADALGRIPTSSAQVAVEKYTMSDGSTRYLTYVTGTRTSPWEGGRAEPWDMKSNVELYQGEEAASYRATLAAIEAAGAQPGDRVDVVGYSQGGMIATHLSMESPYDVTMQVTAGSPQEPTLDADQTLVQLRHTDDLVSALAAGGSTSGTGSADSFTASRVGDPAVGLHDLSLQTHALETYLDTAEMVDASDDPRAEALDDYWEELAEAEAVERIEYHAERRGAE